MFGLGFGEILLILAIALIVIGPKKLPDVARAIGRGLAEFRRHADDVQKTIQRELYASQSNDAPPKSASPNTQYRPGPPPDESGPSPMPPAEPRPAENPAESGHEGPTGSSGPAA